MEGALAVSFQRVGAAIAEARPMRQRNDVQLRQIVCEPGNMGDNEYIPRLNPDFLTRNKVLAYNFSRCLARKIPRAMIGRRHATYGKGDLLHVGALPQIHDNRQHSIPALRILGKKQNAAPGRSACRFCGSHFSHACARISSRIALSQIVAAAKKATSDHRWIDLILHHRAVLRRTVWLLTV
jgi:hypothetical protein